MLIGGQTDSRTKSTSRLRLPVHGCTVPPKSPPLVRTRFLYPRHLPLLQPQPSTVVGRLPSVMVEDTPGLETLTDSPLVKMSPKSLEFHGVRLLSPRPGLSPLAWRSLFCRLNSGSLFKPSRHSFTVSP